MQTLTFSIIGGRWLRNRDASVGIMAGMRTLLGEAGRLTEQSENWGKGTAGSVDRGKWSRKGLCLGTKGLSVMRGGGK